MIVKDRSLYLTAPCVRNTVHTVEFSWFDSLLLGTSLCLDPYFLSHDFMNITGRSHFPNHPRGVADIRGASLFFFFLGTYYITDSFSLLNSQVLWTNYKTDIIIRVLDTKTNILTSNSRISIQKRAYFDSQGKTFLEGPVLMEWAL